MSQDILVSAGNKLWAEKSLSSSNSDFSLRHHDWTGSEVCILLNTDSFSGRKAIAMRSLTTHLSLVSRLRTPGYIRALHHAYF